MVLPSVSIPDEFSAAAGFYHLLERLWLTEVDTSLLQELQHGSLKTLAAELELPVNDAPQHTLLENLAVAYCQLLVGPANHVPPYQSVWTEGQFQSAATTSMQAYLDVLGEATTESSMLDHLGIQFRVMRSILSELAASDHESPRHAELHAMATQFFHDHLTWPGKFLNAAEQATESAFYQQLVRVTVDFLEQEQHYWSN